MRFELGTAAGRPDYADIPDQPARLIGDDARAGGVGHITAVIADDRVAIRVAHRVAARHFDILDPCPGDEGQRGSDRHGYIAADIGVADALIEIGDVFLIISGADTDADRQRVARARPGTHGSAMRDAFVEQVGLRSRLGEEIGAVDACIPDTVIRAHIDSAHAGLQIGPGIGRIGLGGEIVVDQRIDHRTALRIDTCAACQPARLEGQDPRDDRRIAAREAGDRVRIRPLRLMREIAFVAQRHAAAIVAPRDRGVDAGR